METQVGLKKILKKGVINSELEFERASIVHRKLRLLIKEHPELAEDYNQLSNILYAYEAEHWVDVEITTQQIIESDLAEQIASYENTFYMHRKQLIKSKLKEKNLTQKQFGSILGHASETYMSELISGINPFTLNDLILIHKLLGIGIAQLIPTTLNMQIIIKVRDAILKLNNPKLKFDIKELAMA